MSKNKKHALGGVGEVLWDIFPDTKKLGGAPANFAAHAQQLGTNSFLLSAVGKDPLGQKAIAHLQHLQVDTSGIQVNEDFATGSVTVSLDPMGNPSYDIQENVAWDNIEFDTNQKKNCARFRCPLFWNFGPKKFPGSKQYFENPQVDLS